MSIKVLIIGGGFYGASIAKHIDLNINESEVYLIEKENDLITKASLIIKQEYIMDITIQILHNCL